MVKISMLWLRRVPQEIIQWLPLMLMDWNLMHTIFQKVYFQHQAIILLAPFSKCVQILKPRTSPIFRHRDSHWGQRTPVTKEYSAKTRSFSRLTQISAMSNNHFKIFRIKMHQLLVKDQRKLKMKWILILRVRCHYSSNISTWSSRTAKISDSRSSTLRSSIQILFNKWILSTKIWTILLKK